MATEIKTWEIINGELSEIDISLAENGRKEKDDLEKWIKTNLNIIGDNILIFWGTSSDKIRSVRFYWY